MNIKNVIDCIQHKTHVTADNKTVFYDYGMGIYEIKYVPRINKLRYEDSALTCSGPKSEQGVP